MLNGDVLANDIETGLSDWTDYKDATGFQNKFNGIIKSHMEQMMITFSWSAANTSGAPDPIVKATGNISFPSFMAIPAMGETILCLNIANSLKLGIITLDVEGLEALPILNPAGVIATTLTTSVFPSSVSYKTVMKLLYNEIVSSIKSSFVNPTPVPGTHGAFSGNLTMVKIS